MNSRQRKQLKDARKRMIDLDLTAGMIAQQLGTSNVIISQLVNGHNYYPRYAMEIFNLYGICIPDTRENRRRQIAKAA
jgi:hypothetical protein